MNPTQELPDTPLIGGLSSIFHVGGGIYYVVSDDRGTRGPARYYTFSIDLTDQSLEPEDVTVNQWEELRDPDGERFPPRTYDLEGLVAHGQGIYVSSEGDASAGIPPYVAVFGPDGRMVERLGLPPGFAPSPDGSTGVRNNSAFEALAITPDGRYLFTATENSLTQDGPAATPRAGAVARLLRFNRDAGVFDVQYAYPVEPVHTTSPDGGLEVNGVVELLALDTEHLVALERSFVAGVANEHSIKLFDVCLRGATDISDIASLADADPQAFRPVAKRLVADIAELVERSDNLEGMTFGPSLADGRRSLVFVSDDNFAPERQITQFLAFAVADDALRGCE